MAEYEAYKDSGFEWLGKIPVPWTMALLSQVVTQVKNKNSDLQEQNLLSLSYGQIKRKPIDTSGGLLPESFDGYNIIEANDIVLRLTDLQNDHRSLRVGLATERGIITSAYTTMRPRNPESAKYLYYLLHTFDIRKGFYGMGSGVRQGLNYDEVKKLKLPIPSLAEQTVIAEYLDRETERIDAIIAEAKASIEEYKAWKASIIYEAVTKGLDPNAEMKDSGVERIGEIPKSWSIFTLGSLSESIRNGYVGPTKDLFYEEGIRYIQSLHVKEGKINFTKHEYYVSKEWGEKHPKVCTGDLVIVQTGDIGQVGLVTPDYDGCNCHALIIVSPRRDVVYPKYEMYYFLNPIGKELLLKTKTGATLPHLNSGKIKSTAVCLPPYDEQIEIAEYLDKKCNGIDSLIAEKEALITDLESYKKSLIFEIVTGKRKVV